MVRRGCSEFRRQLRAAGVRKLVDMRTQLESKLLRGHQNPSRLLDIEVTALTKDVAKLGQLFRRDSRQHLVDHKIDIYGWSIFARDRMRAQECRNNFQRRLLTESPH